MKAAVLYGQKDIRYDEIEMPVIKDDEILVKVKNTGVCGSDIPRCWECRSLLSYCVGT